MKYDSKDNLCDLTSANLLDLSLRIELKFWFKVLKTKKLGNYSSREVKALPPAHRGQKPSLFSG
ncbi:MAG: hypothetical protein AAF487_09800, partial [Bacteroidota bacterium]